MTHKQMFWLHVKKTAGTTVRALLKPYYIEVENRENKPKTFIQATPEEYNDIINTYRVALGDYQFKRCLFAKKYLYPDQWDNMFSFAFSREPMDRCLSMFYYLFWKDRGARRKIVRSVRKSIKNKRLIYYNTSYAFDLFLDALYEARSSDSIYKPGGIHFTTHTAPMWDDITDSDGNVLLSQVYRQEKLVEGINLAFEQCGIPKRLDVSHKQLNKNTDRKDYTPNKNQRKKVEDLYLKDFEIYENAWH